ncbi:MAG: NifU family protein [Acidimicrobiales bacterium]
MAQPQNLRAAGDRIENLLDELKAATDPRAFDRIEELMRLVTELYGAGLARVVELAQTSGAVRLEDLTGDDLLSSLLLVHGLHPESLVVRVEKALAEVRPFLAGHGGDVELIDIDAEVGAVNLRLLGSCDGCPSSAVTLQSAVERAIVEAAPEIVIIDVEDPTEPEPGVPVALSVKPSYDHCPTEMAET